jgi:hypothetical protein
MENIKSAVESYYQAEIARNDTAHNLDHIRSVAEKVIVIRKDLYPDNPEFDYLLILCAYLHDLKCHVSRKMHNELASEYILTHYKTDKFLKELCLGDVKRIANAVYLHRSSIELDEMNPKHKDPLVLILRLADKNRPELREMLKRSLKFNKYNAEGVLNHLKEKFSRNGYASKDKHYAEYYKKDLEQLWNKIDKLTLRNMERYSKYFKSIDSNL